MRFEPIHPPELAFENPVWAGAIPGLPGQLAVVEHQTGKIWRLDRNADGDGSGPRKELFADLGGEIYFSPEQGLMSLAFHPDLCGEPAVFPGVRGSGGRGR